MELQRSSWGEIPSVFVFSHFQRHTALRSVDMPVASLAHVSQRAHV